MKVHTFKMKITNFIFFMLLFVSVFFFSYVSTTDGYAVTTEWSQYGYISLIILILVLQQPMINRKVEKKIRINTLQMIMLFTVLLLMFLSTITFVESFRFLLVVIIWNILVFLLFTSYYNSVGFRKELFVIKSTLFIFWIGILSFIIALVLYFLGEISIGPINLFQLEGTPRYYGWYGNPNRFGGVMALSLLSAIYLYKKKSKEKLRIIGFLLFSIGLIFSGSKGAMFSLLIAFVSYVIYRLIKSKRVGSRTLFITILLMLVISFFAFNSDKYISNTFKEQILRLDNFDNSRFDIWENILLILNQNTFFTTLFGNGYGYFQSYVGLSPHNSYIRWISDFGLLFLFIISLFFIFILKGILSQKKDELELLMCFFIFLVVQQFFTQSIFQVRFEGMMFWFVVVSVLFSIKKDAKKYNEG